jgi:hypothetical protein
MRAPPVSHRRLSSDRGSGDGTKVKSLGPVRDRGGAGGDTCGASGDTCGSGMSQVQQWLRVAAQPLVCCLCIAAPPSVPANSISRNLQQAFRVLLSSFSYHRSRSNHKKRSYLSTLSRTSHAEICVLHACWLPFVHDSNTAGATLQGLHGGVTPACPIHLLSYIILQGTSWLVHVCWLPSVRICVSKTCGSGALIPLLGIFASFADHRLQ